MDVKDNILTNAYKSLREKFSTSDLWSMTLEEKNKHLVDILKKALGSSEHYDTIINEIIKDIENAQN